MKILVADQLELMFCHYNANFKKSNPLPGEKFAWRFAYTSTP